MNEVLTIITRVALAILFTTVEVAAMGRSSPFYWVVRRTQAHRLGALAPHFAPDFYLLQIGSPARRQRASRNPILHYLLVGWREFRSPNRRFDPRFFRDYIHPDSYDGEPLRRFLDMPNHELLPQNEAEASRCVADDINPQKTALVFHHARGGGSSKYLSLFENRLRDEDVKPIRLRAVPGCGRLLIWPNETGENEVFQIDKDVERFSQKAKDAFVDLIIVSHVVDFPPSIFSFIEQCASKTQGQLWFILHDYFSVCPRVNLVDAWGRPCAIPAPSACSACVAKGGGEIGSADPAKWQPRFLDFLAQADRIFVPSQDTKTRLSPFIDQPLEVWSPELDDHYPPLRLPVLGIDETLQVAVLGSLNRAKGSQVLLELAQCIRKARAPVEITLFGTSSITRQLESKGVKVLGRYREGDLQSLLSAASPHIVLFPAIWPETWSFVLTTALELGLPIMSFAHGAQFERLQRVARGDQILPLDWIDKPEEVLETLMAFRASCFASGEIDHHAL